MCIRCEVRVSGLVSIKVHYLYYCTGIHQNAELGVHPASTTLRARLKAREMSLSQTDIFSFPVLNTD